MPQAHTRLVYCLRNMELVLSVITTCTTTNWPYAKGALPW